jgi:hypothetical protein
MHPLNSSVVSLRVLGNDVDPAEIARLLGREPTSAQRKGEALTGPAGQTNIARTGMWRLETADRSPGNINAQVAELLGQLTPSLDVWRAIAAKHSIDLFCGLFMDQGNEEIALSPDSMKALGDRGIELGLDIYAPPKD